MKAPLALSLLFAASACGGGSGSPDAAPPPIDGPMTRLNVVIDDMNVCPDGWTEGLSATETANRIEIVGSCSADFNEVLLQFAPPPEPGGTAPCFQATMQIGGGPRVNCRVNNQVLMAPEGELTLQVGETPLLVGECGCVGDEEGGAAEGGASFQLLLEE